jgi:4-alpha-glucanotransferase
MGAAGWRLDVADELPDEFIKNMKSVLKETDPESILLGEVWEDASNKVSYGVNRRFLWGEELDTVMNYPFRNILSDFILGHIDAHLAGRRFMNYYENYPGPHFYNLMNLIGTHDIPRILTILGEAPAEDTLNTEQKEKFKLNPRQRRLALSRLKLMVIFQMTFPGVPSVYYGDEAGMEGYSDPLNRGPYPWGREDMDLLAFHKKIINLRNNFIALQKGR